MSAHISTAAMPCGAKGELARAGEDYAEAIRLAPDKPGGFSGRGQIRLLTHDFVGAVADFGTALKLNPNDVNSHINRGAALSLLGENLRALSDFDQVIALEPQNPLGYVERGQVMHALGDNAGAYAAVNVALKLVPNFPPALDALKTIGTPKNAAQIRAALGRPVAAGECMMPVADIRLDARAAERTLTACTGLANSPGGSAADRSLAFMQRGSMHRRLEKYELALADFDQALRYVAKAPSRQKNP
jgi:tetratricopeptide (TPR) repeat protein